MRISVTGSGFLYNMVRIMVGTLLEVARGAILPEEISGIIESRDRSRAGATAPEVHLEIAVEGCKVDILRSFHQRNREKYQDGSQRQKQQTSLPTRILHW